MPTIEKVGMPDDFAQYVQNGISQLEDYINADRPPNVRQIEMLQTLGRVAFPDLNSNN